MRPTAGQYVAEPYRYITHGYKIYHLGNKVRMRGPNPAKTPDGAACPKQYPKIPTIPAVAPTSGGLNKIHAPSAEATIVAIAIPVPKRSRLTIYSSKSLVCLL